MDLHPKCVDALRKRLPSALRDIGVFGNRVIDYQSVQAVRELDDSLPQRGAVVEELHQYIGPRPFSTFVVGLLEELLARAKLPLDSKLRKLIELPLEMTLEELADEIIHIFLTLPWDYTFMYPLPHWVVDPLLKESGRDALEVVPGLSLIRWRQSYASTFPVPKERERPEQRPFSGLFTEQLKIVRFGAIPPSPRACYLQVSARGFVPRLGPARLVDVGERTLRALCGLGIAFGIWGRGVASLSGSEVYALSWRKTGEGWEYCVPRLLPPELAQALLALQMTREPDSLRHATKWSTGGWHKRRFEEISALYSDESEGGQAIVRAARWLFDSFVGSNELLSFVQAMVCAEILLGDKAESEKTGLMELLANRCAYLIGKTRDERDRLLKEFKDIYATRSDIVHSGVEELTEQDEERLRQLRSICTQAIRRETELLLLPHTS